MPGQTCKDFCSLCYAGKPGPAKPGIPKYLDIYGSRVNRFVDFCLLGFLESLAWPDLKFLISLCGSTVWWIFAHWASPKARHGKTWNSQIFEFQGSEVFRGWASAKAKISVWENPRFSRLLMQGQC